ncbi:MAG TPA: hypothetical protein VJT32_13990 [bacterium]|nr:hypothetical protein [bacterium]
MKEIAFVVVGAVMFAAMLGEASAQPYPTEAALTPFSAGTNYMSPAGYARYLTLQVGDPCAARAGMWYGHSGHRRTTAQWWKMRCKSV